MDRRATRTRRALHEALISLILRKGYEAITIQEIIDEADVGRSTFYSHYSGKEDLLRGGLEQLRKELAAIRADAAARHRDPRNEPLGFSLAIFEQASRYKHVYRALVGGRGGTVALNELRRILSDVVQDEFSSTIEDRSISRELIVQFVAGAFLTVLTWWLERNAKPKPAEVDAMFRRFVIPGIEPFVGSTPPDPELTVD